MPVFWAGDRSVDTDERVIQGACESTQLTVLESAMLGYLFANRGRMVDRDELLTEVWGYRSKVQSRTVDTTLARLRKKLEPDPKRPRFLRSRRGVGIELRGVTTRPVEEEWRVRVSYPQGPALIGRDEDMEALVQQVETPGWIAMVGAVGVGKSALALALLRQWDDGQSSPLFADCTACTHLDSLLARVAEAVGLTNAEPRVVDRGLKHLRNPLLVLSNIEGLEAPALGWVQAQTTLRLVSTSSSNPRQARLFRLMPLEDESARSLLSERVQRSGYQPSAEAIEAAIEWAGGLPLALELFAPVLEILGPEVQRWALEVEGEDRQGQPRSLQTALDASWAHLDDTTRAVWVGCSAFRGCFELDAASAACARSSVQVLRAIALLRDRGIISAKQGWMQVIAPARLYGAERAGDLKAVEQRVQNFLLSRHSDLILGSPKQARAYRADLLRSLDTVARDERIPLLEIVFIGCIKGDWVFEALPSLQAAIGLWTGEADALLRLFLSELSRVRTTPPSPAESPNVPNDLSLLSHTERTRLGLALGRPPVDPPSLERFLQSMAGQDQPLDVWLRLVAASSLTTSDITRDHLEALALLARSHGWSGVDDTARGLLALSLNGRGKTEQALRLLDELESDEHHDGGLFLLRLRCNVLVDASRYDDATKALVRMRSAARRTQLDATALSGWAVLVYLAWLESDGSRMKSLLTEEPELPKPLRAWIDLAEQWLAGVPLDEVACTQTAASELIERYQQGDDPRHTAEAEMIPTLFARLLHQGLWSATPR